MCKCIYVEMSTNYRDTSTLLHWRWSLGWAKWQVYEWYSTRPTTTSHHLLWLLSSSFFLHLLGWQISDDGTFSRQSWCVNKTAAGRGCVRLLSGLWRDVTRLNCVIDARRGQGDSRAVSQWTFAKFHNARGRPLTTTFSLKLPTVAFTKLNEHLNNIKKTWN